jgi:hypothetical protein
MSRTSIGVLRARVTSGGCVVLEIESGKEWRPTCHMAAEVADALGRELREVAQESRRRQRESVRYVDSDGVAVPINP